MWDIYVSTEVWLKKMKKKNSSTNLDESQKRITKNLEDSEVVYKLYHLNNFYENINFNNFIFG